MSSSRREFLQAAAGGAIAGAALGEFALAEQPVQALKPPAGGLKIVAPLPYEVVQRSGFDPLEAHPHAVGGPKLGSAVVELVWQDDGQFPKSMEWEYAVELLTDAYGTAVAWTKLEKVTASPGRLTGLATVAAGGWYRLALRGKVNGAIIASGQVEPFGVGEVLLIAGQSYAGGYNDEILKVTEPQGRVTVLDTAKKTWRVAHDPQPQPGDGGTIWPALGNLLVPLLKTPVGFANVSVGATSSIQWLPKGPLHTQLVAVSGLLKRFRAVLWQQGESDVIAGTTTAAYVANLQRIRTESLTGLDISPPWILAKSTLHPTVYNNPKGEAAIRAGIEELCRSPGFVIGPDTDILDGPHRGGPKTRRHFSGLGQQRAALLWFAAIWSELMGGAGGRK